MYKTKTLPETRGRRFLRWLNTRTSAAITVTMLCLAGMVACWTIAGNSTPPAQSSSYITLTEAMIGKLNVDRSGTILVPTTDGLTHELHVQKVPELGAHIQYWELNSTHEVAETHFPTPRAVTLGLLGVCFLGATIAGGIVSVRRYRKWLEDNPDMRLPA